MEKPRLQKLQEMLEAEKRELLAVVDRLTGPGGLESPRDEASMELSAYDNHPGDYGSEMYERSKDLGLLEMTRAQIEEIEEAQRSIIAGDYGYCRVCGQAIPEKRLLALPSTRLCVQCKRSMEDQDSIDRPVEETLLMHPFGRTFTDETDNVAFDGEDAWEAVARYGTSSDLEKH
ncbi:MAG: hypothetical protein GX971_03925 [Firmicutes bacterium]|nr:hypothetical protein [Bacillota bacterium]